MTLHLALLGLHKSSDYGEPTQQLVAGFCPWAWLRTSNEPLPETKTSCLLLPPSLSLTESGESAANQRYGSASETLASSCLAMACHAMHSMHFIACPCAGRLLAERHG